MPKIRTYLPYELFIALRYLLAQDRKRFISLITLFSIAGVTIGVMALIITLAVMGGFERDLKQKIMGLNGQILVLSGEQTVISDYRGVIKKITSSEPDIMACSPLIQTQAILSSKYDNAGVVLRGILPDMEAQVTNLKNYTQIGSYSVEESDILLGSELAKKLGVWVGDSILLFTTGGNNLITMNPGLMPQTLVVKGIFTSGMYEYDLNMAYLSLPKLQQILGLKASITGIAVKIQDAYQARSVAKRIEKKLGYTYWTRTWMEMNKNLFSALQLERSVMFVILCLIILVAGFNIASTLIMTVLKKTKEIGILKSMGAGQINIQIIFIIQGLIIGLLGTLIGCAGGIAGCKLLSEYDLVRLPRDVYYFSRIPVDMRWSDIGLVSLAAIILSLIFALYPARSAAKLDPVEALRYE